MQELLSPPSPAELNGSCHGDDKWERQQEDIPSSLRVAHLTNEIPPYRAPFYEELAATPGWDFKVFTCIDREADRLWEVRRDVSFAVRQCYSLSYIRRKRHTGPESFEDLRQVHLPVGLFGDLWGFRPDVIISGEMGARSLIAALYAKLSGAKLVITFEGTPHTERDVTIGQRWLRRMIRRAPDAFTVDGRQGRSYLQSLNVPPSSIFEIGQPIDTTTFTNPRPAGQRNSLREEMGVSGLCYLFCGRLIPLKGLDQLLDAWEVFARQSGVNATLLLAGEGCERSRLEQRVAKAGLDGVRFLGHVPRERLPAIYQAADVFVLPTLMDCWALVVNEAMASGLPVINSKYTGSADFIVDGETGWVVDPFDRADMLTGLRRAWDARSDLPHMKQSVLSAIESMSISAVARRLRRAVAYVRTATC